MTTTSEKLCEFVTLCLQTLAQCEQELSLNDYSGVIENLRDSLEKRYWEDVNEYERITGESYNSNIDLVLEWRLKSPDLEPIERESMCRDYNLYTFSMDMALRQSVILKKIQDVHDSASFFCVPDNVILFKRDI